MGYNLHKHQVFQKLGSLSIEDNPVLSTPALTTQPVVAGDHGLKIKSRHHLPLYIAGGILITSGLLVSLFFTVGHGSLTDIYVAGLPVKADISQTELQQQITTATKTYKLKVKYTDGKVKSFPLAATGVSIDVKKSASKTKSSINQSLVRRLEWWKPIKLELVTKSDDPALYSFVTKEVTQVKVAPTDASLAISNGVAGITPEAEGSGSTVPNGKKEVVSYAAKLRSEPMVLKPMKLAPAITSKDLESGKTHADEILAKSVSFTIAGHNVVAAPADIGGWLDVSPVPNAKTVDVTVNSGKVLQYIDKVARRYITPPHSRLVTTTDSGQLVLDYGSDGVDVVNKEQTASEVAKKIAKDPSVSTSLAVKYTPAKTVETEAFDKWFVADVTTKRMYAYEKTTLVRSFLISAGAPATPTVLGTYKIYAKYGSQTMTGFNADGSRYRQPDVPYVNYFTGGYAIHGNYWRPASYFGNINSSHGCIGINVEDAAWIYNWAPIGTTVVTHN